ncbi:FMN-binding negative transcriptional regulator [Streptomyces sp. NPDC003470]
MFVPEAFAPPEPGWITELIRGFPLATLVTHGPRRPYVTHLPALLEADVEGTGEAPADLVGTKMYGHLNRANPHWEGLAGPSEAVLVFQGPHGYVSPTVYRAEPAAPTWNFTAVHVQGTLRRIESPERTLEIVRATVATYEREQGTGWDMRSSLGYFDRLLPGVGAFEIDIASVDGMFKLSQDQSPERRTRVSDAFARSGRGLHGELAALMGRLGTPPREGTDGPR